MPKRSDIKKVLVIGSLSDRRRNSTTPERRRALRCAKRDTR